MFVILSLLLASVAWAQTGIVSVTTSLSVRASASSSGTKLYSLYNGASISIICAQAGTSVSGSQGTTNLWGQINSNQYGIGYTSLAYVRVSGTPKTCGSNPTPAGTGKVITTGTNSLTVRSAASTSGTALYSVPNGGIVTITCKTTGTSVSGTQGTTSVWYQIEGAGYASAAYINSAYSFSTCAAPPPPSPGGAAFQKAMAFGNAQIGTLYVGCAGGNYRLGQVASQNMYHDGRTCGQSRVYFQPAGSVGYDCSGLMIKMFAAAGISLPYYSSTAIKAYVPKIAKGAVVPGDMFAKNGHVVMYIGNNQVIESTNIRQRSDSAWIGTQIKSSAGFMSSADYTAHRYPGLA